MDLDTHKANILNQRASAYKSELEEYLERSLARFDLQSPIEELLALALISRHWDYWTINLDDRNISRYLKCCENYLASDKEWGELCSLERSAFILSQYPIGKYKADFAIFIGHPESYRKIAIECDGHDFHEKTKFQVSRDKKRDRFFVGNGWRLLRFSGSEIFKNPIPVADEIIEYACELIDSEVIGNGR